MQEQPQFDFLYSNDTALTGFRFEKEHGLNFILFVIEIVSAEIETGILRFKSI